VKPVVYQCEADVEVVESAKRYECRRKGLGRRFLHEIHMAEAKIQIDPARFPYFEEPTRSCRVRGFPYAEPRARLLAKPIELG
jgi:hypothetical protein